MLQLLTPPISSTSEFSFLAAELGTISPQKNNFYSLVFRSRVIEVAKKLPIIHKNAYIHFFRPFPFTTITTENY
jgi:hypothetical protein